MSIAHHRLVVIFITNTAHDMRRRSAVRWMALVTIGRAIPGLGWRKGNCLRLSFGGGRMASSGWVVVKQGWCEQARQEVRLLERRVYPAEILPDTAGYRTTARRCEHDVACNLLGFNCCWAFTRPEFDPFGFA